MAKILACKLMLRNRERNILHKKDKLDDAKKKLKQVRQQPNGVKRYLFVKICHMFS